jgi:hypothetical protein
MLHVLCFFLSLQRGQHTINKSEISPRRFGKTGLIYHVFYTLKGKKKDVFYFYFDIFSTQNLHEFVQVFGKTVLGKLDNYSHTIRKFTSPYFTKRSIFVSYIKQYGQIVD